MDKRLTHNAPIGAANCAMTSPQSLGDLIARLEKAKEGRPLLDWYIYWSLHPDYSGQSISEPRTDDDYRILHHLVAPFTTSLDAALTLVPDGWGINIHLSPQHHNCEQSASLMRGDPPYFDGEEIAVSGATAIIALCIASLKARLGEGR
jgi:hypothetical protein